MARSRVYLVPVTDLSQSRFGVGRHIVVGCDFVAKLAKPGWAALRIGTLGDGKGV